MQAIFHNSKMVSAIFELACMVYKHFAGLLCHCYSVTKCCVMYYELFFCVSSLDLLLELCISL